MKGGTCTRDLYVADFRVDIWEEKSMWPGSYVLCCRRVDDMGWVFNAACMSASASSRQKQPTGNPVVSRMLSLCRYASHSMKKCVRVRTGMHIRRLTFLRSQLATNSRNHSAIAT
jgi:hypothetical protein